VSVYDLALFSLNIRFGLADDGPDSWRHRRHFFPVLLKRYPADFYAFQEVNDFQAEDLQAMLAGYRCIGQRKPAPACWQSNLIFYHPRWRCTEKYHFYLSPTPDIPSRFEESKWPRQCTIGIFNHDSLWVVCVNTHFDFAETVQEKSARLIRTRLSTLSVTEPAIIMGDFNTSPDGHCYPIFTRSGPAGKAAASKDESPFKNIFQPPFPATHHGFTGKADEGPIDWILYRGPIVPVERQVVQDAFDGHYPSDHFPLWVRFRWIH